MLDVISEWKEKKKTEYVSLKVLYEQGKTGNHEQSKAFVYDSFLKTKQGQLHYIKQNEWRKQYLSFKVGQIIVWHPQKKAQGDLLG